MMIIPTMVTATLTFTHRRCGDDNGDNDGGGDYNDDDDGEGDRVLSVQII